MLDTTQLVNYLRKLHLFRGVRDDQLVAISRELKEQKPCKAGEIVVRQGDPGDGLFFIYSGKVAVLIPDTSKPAGGTKTLATLIPGDYFGEESLVTKHKRNATIQAEAGTILLKLGVESYRSLVGQFPQLGHNFNVMVGSRRLARKLNFSWLQPNESIYYLASRHPVTVIRWVAAPVVVGVVLLLLASLVNDLIQRTWINTIFAVLALLDLLWFIWNWVDWSNDYYIVTNERVVRTEKIVALYDSREEAPLSTIISVNVNSGGPLQRQIGLGDVVVRTFTTQITLYDVEYPNAVESMVMEYWNRAKERITSVEKDAIEKALRSRLDPPPEAPVSEIPPPTPKQESYATTIYQMLFANFLKVRFEDSNVVTYRKHWFVLVRDTFKQFVLTILLLSAPVTLATSLGQWFSVSGWSIWVVLLLLVLGWWFYDYVDWVNDVYKVTPDQIVDIYKKPLGKEQRKSAQLESIMSTSSERKGILGLLLNYGIVKIRVGVEVFDFTDVFDPPQVEQDIIRRLAARRNKKNEAEKVADAERMGNWLANYHKISKELDSNEQGKE